MPTWKPLPDRLAAAAERRLAQYHATRVLLDVRPDGDGATAGRGRESTRTPGGVSSWVNGSGCSRPGSTPRWGRWHQSCFFGEADSLNEYSALAAEAWQALPVSFAAPLDVNGRRETDRDVWTLALYRFALKDRTLFRLDLRSTLAYGDTVVRGLDRVVARTRDGVRGEGVVVEDFREMHEAIAGRRPEFVFATLRADVFTATRLAVNVLLERGRDLHPWPGDLCAFAAIASAAGCPPEEPIRQYTLGHNEERDAYLYRHRCKGATLAELSYQTGTRSGWDELTTPQGVARAVNRFADRHGLVRPSSRKG